MWAHRRASVFTLFGFVVAATLFAFGQGQRPAVQNAPLNSADVERWADQVFGKIVAEHRVSALAIAVTQGEKVVLTKGYGYADWATKAPVSPENTQFRIGSLTKTFLATAIAQLLERGRIASLDDPVNKYLKRVQIRNPFGKEITIWDMLTHQGGLGNAPTIVADTGGPRPLPLLPADFVTARTPAVVREPGKVSIYCNPCSATLGFMVEDITGVKLEDYLRENVFTPLGMTNTVLTNSPQPSSTMVKQYAFAPNAAPVAQPYPAIDPYISYAGDMNSTAGDMAKWLIAHIQAGQGSGKSILAPRSYALMHRRHRGNSPQTSGFGMGFFNYDYNGERIIEHYGSIQHRSLEIMMLDRKIGVFVTMAGGGQPGQQTPPSAGNTLQPITGPVERAVSHSGARALILEYFLGKLPFNKDTKVDLSKYTGVYQNLSRNPNAPAGAGGGIRIQDSGDGGLIIDGRGVFRPSGPDIFTLDGTLPLEAGFGTSNRYEFVRDAAGNMRMFGHINAGGYERTAAQ